MDGGDFGKSLDNAIKGLGCFCFFVVLGGIIFATVYFLTR